MIVSVWCRVWLQRQTVDSRMTMKEAAAAFGVRSDVIPARQRKVAGAR